MVSQEEIADQHALLRTYRRTLTQYLKQQATFTDAFVPPSVALGMQEARDNIRRIKGILRDWGVAVDDHPDDDPTSVAWPGHRSRARIFISYKRDEQPDEPVALEVYRALSQRYEVFIDQKMPVGTYWAERIEAELGRSDFLITFLSDKSVHSEMVEAEIKLASRLASRNGGRPAILPVRLAYREPFHYPLSAYLDPINWVFWNGAQDTPHVIDELLRAIVVGELSEPRRDIVQPMKPTALPRPTSSAQLELPEGTMDCQSAFYVVRPSDTLALNTIARVGVTITIKGPRQMGKSSLLIRTIEAAVQAGKRVAFLDFQLFERTVLSDADRFFRQFCAWFTRVLKLPDRVDEYWSIGLGNSQSCTLYVGDYLLHELAGPLMLAMDEVESLFEAGFRSDFFGMLRSWHNNRAFDPAWKQFDLVLVTSTEPYQLIENPNQSPFNVGQVIELVDLTLEQVADLNRRHGTPLRADEERELMRLLGGHPYLVRRALYLVAGEHMSSADLFGKAADDHGPFGDHLRNHLFRLHDQPALVHSLLQVIRHHKCDDERAFFRLRGAGLVRRDKHVVLPRCPLYTEYFRERLHG